ncbi:hypothetical protein SLA2020_069930 [Shorea laevis]
MPSNTEIAEVDDDSPILKTKSLSEVYESCNLAISEPSSYEVAAKQDVWLQAMQEEIAMIEKNKIWYLTKKPQDKNVIGVKWVYRTKLNPNGSIHKYKARLVVKGYAQELGVDYGETFAPVARHDTIKLLVALAANLGWKLYHMDVKSAFLNGILEEEIYVEQPQGFEVAGKEDYVYRLNKALYGLKQAPRAWYSIIDDYLLQQDFRRSKNEATLYVKGTNSGSQLIVSLYVDDLLLTGGNEHLLNNFKAEMMKEFEMLDLGEMKYFLGMEIEQYKNGIFISQRKYALDVLKKFGMEDCKSVATPLVLNEKYVIDDGKEKANSSSYRSLIGSLLYLTASRPDLMYLVSLLSRFMSSPNYTHFSAAKRVLRYLKGTFDYGIWYEMGCKRKLEGYVDSDWAGCEDDMKSTTDYVFSIGSGAFTWISKKQDVVAQSIAEAEYVAAFVAANQAVWLRKMLVDLGFNQDEACLLKIDNMSAISIAQNPIQHGRTKHIKVKYHVIRNFIKEKEISLQHCDSEEQNADILTKSLPKPRFEKLREKLGVTKPNTKEEC